MKPDIQLLLRELVEMQGSDLHLSVGSQPHFRIDEMLVPAKYDKLTQEDTKDLAYSILTPEQIKRFEEKKELDMSFGIEELGRFRVNVFYQRGYIGVAIRALPLKIMSFEECGLQVDVATKFTHIPSGLVLVTGATGSGKSTTLAAMIENINQRRSCHIVTVEDPIEYVYKNKKAIIDQREIGEDTYSFAYALRHIVRQDPDVILIGEMRDLETIEAALNIAETGHLVFATLHTSDCAQTINRIIDVFPEHKQNQVRIQLSFVLVGIISQQLIPKKNERGRVLATEILIANHAIRSLIRETKTHQIYSTIQTSQKENMRTMNQSLYELCMNGIISYEDAISRTIYPDELVRVFGKV